MLSHVVIVDRFLLEQSLRDEHVHCGTCRVRGLEQRGAVGLAEEVSVQLDARVGADHLQVQGDPLADERFS